MAHSRTSRDRTGTTRAEGTRVVKGYFDFTGDGRQDLFVYDVVTGRWFLGVNVNVNDEVGGFAYVGGAGAPGRAARCRWLTSTATAAMTRSATTPAQATG